MKKFLLSLINLLLLSCPFAFGDVIADTSFDSGITMVLFSICLLLLLLFIILLYAIDNIFFKGKRKKSKDTDFNNNDDNKNE
jgi:hypothetical protein